MQVMLADPNGDALQSMNQARNILLLTDSYQSIDGQCACAAFDMFLRFQYPGRYVETLYFKEPSTDVPYPARNYSIGQTALKPDLIIAFDTTNPCQRSINKAFENVPIIRFGFYPSAVSLENPMVYDALPGLHFVNTRASSACELVYDFINARFPEKSIYQYIAMNLLYGILSKTRSLQNRNTNANTLRAVAQLMDCGANLKQLQQRLKNSRANRRR